MRLGAVENVIRGIDETGTFQQAKRLSFEGVEIVPTRQQLQSPGRERIEYLQYAQAQSGLKIPSLMLSEHNTGGIANSDPAIAEAAMEDIRAAIDWAAALQASVILVPFFFGGEIVTEEDFERAVQGFRELCPLAHDKGIKLCYEGTLPAEAIQRLAEQIGSEAFSCYFDLANVVWRGMDTATEIRALGSLIHQVHMKDTRVGPGDCHPGLGRVDYAESAKALREIGYDGWIVLETPAALPELIARDISFTKYWFPELKARDIWPRLGAFSYGFKRGGLDHLIDSFKHYDLNAVQIASEILEEALADPAAIPSMRNRLEANGITVAGLAGYRNLVAPDPTIRRANIDFLQRCLRVAPLFGTSVVATETGTRHPESDWLASPENLGQEAWELLYAALEELLPVAEQHGSILAIEAYVNNVVQHQGQLIGLLERFPTQHLQVVLDPFNYLSRHLLPARERIVTEFLDRFEHRFVLTHLKDVSAEGAEVGTPEFGQGVFPHKLYLDFLRTRRPDLPIIFEHLPFDHIPKAKQRLHELTGSQDAT